MNKSKMMHRSAAAVLAALMMAAAGTTALGGRNPRPFAGAGWGGGSWDQSAAADSTYYFPVQYTHPGWAHRGASGFGGGGAGTGGEGGNGPGERRHPHLERPVLCPGGNRRGDPGRGHPRGGTHPAVQPPGEGAELDVAVTAGLRQANLSSVQAGEPVAVRPYMPLYTVPQQMELARLNRWRPVTFTGEGWSFTGTLTAQGHGGFLGDTGEHPGGEAVPAGGAGGLSGVPGRRQLPERPAHHRPQPVPDPAGWPVYAYRYLYGRLYRVPAIHDAEANTITLSVTNLGRYVLTGEKFPEATPVD